jgi:hypothetical protein
MAWVELELDDRTHRSLCEKAKRDGISVAELVRRIATREATREESRPSVVSFGSLGGNRSDSGRAIHAAGRGDT